MCDSEQCKKSNDLEVESLRLYEEVNIVPQSAEALESDHCSQEIDTKEKSSATYTLNDNYDSGDLTLNNHQHENTENKFYEDAKKYWSNIPPTVDGMLGGYGSISMIDIKGSRIFLNELFKSRPKLCKRYALDCGAGIGRITKGLLIPIFEKVDIVEQDPIFIQKAKTFIGETDRIGKLYNVGLQEFIPAPQKYDVVWSQWVLGHLTDDDLFKFLKRIQCSLNKNGLLVIKENVSSSNSLERDDTDSSVTRPLKRLQDIIQLANYRVIKATKQTNFPKGLYPVYIFACRPPK